jgi:serine/threonine-protein kinase
MTDIPERLAAAFADTYELIRQLGSGGMATVYLATDLKHDRQVAIKVLRPELAAVIGGERFISEIKTTAALQHPHILTLFDSGEKDSFLYYVMPYIDGETLRDRLDREKQLSVEESLRIAKGVGSALQYAHERGIVHRDIKPANVLLHAGEPVVADFGIAIAISAAGGGRLTETGMSVGTPHYMSPEQASADRDVDARSDIYALGCITYEMLTGDPPHTGSSAQAVLMRILTENPRAVTDVRRAVPEHVRDAVAKALEKLPADRFGSAQEFVTALQNESFRYTPAPAVGTGQTRAVRAPTAGPSIPVGTGVAAAVALGAGLIIGPMLFGGGSGPDAGTAPMRLELTHAGLTLEDPQTIHVSPDGDQFAFIGDEVITDGIFTRTSGEADFRHLPGTELADFMVFSPDGESIAFSGDDGSIQRIAAGGGGLRTIVPPAQDDRIYIFPTWEDPDWILSAVIMADGPALARVPAAGGDPELLIGGLGDLPFYPRAVPGTDLILHGWLTARTIVVRSMEDDSETILVNDALWYDVLATGEIAWVDGEGVLWVADFDAEAAELTSDPAPVVSGVVMSQGTIANVSISDTGTLVYQQGEGAVLGARALEVLQVLDFAGNRTEISISPRRYRNVRWSPDGASIAFSALEPGERIGRTSLYTYNVELQTATRRLTDEGTQGFPVWSPDGASIAYLDAQSPRGPDGAGLGAILTGDIAMVDLASGESTVLAEQEGQDVPYAWTPDGWIIHTGGVDTGTSDLRLASASEPGTVRDYLDIDGDLGSVAVSPDGRWAVFLTSEAPGVGVQLVARSYPDPGPPIPVTTGPGDRPRWNGAGDAVFYWKAGGDVDSLMVARVRTSPTFEVLSTETLLVGVYNEATWDLHPDGDRILIAVAEAEATTDTEDVRPPRQLAVVNWFEEVRQARGGGGGP